MTVTYSVFTPKFDEFRWKFEIIIKFWAIKKFINALIYPLSNQKNNRPRLTRRKAYNFRLKSGSRKLFRPELMELFDLTS